MGSSTGQRRQVYYSGSAVDVGAVTSLCVGSWKQFEDKSKS